MICVPASGTDLGNMENTINMKKRRLSETGQLRNPSVSAQKEVGKMNKDIQEQIVEEFGGISTTAQDANVAPLSDVRPRKPEAKILSSQNINSSTEVSASLLELNATSSDILPQPLNVIKPAAGTADPRSPIVRKEPMFRLPPVWAESRQEVCESFEWFRSYQGGVYFSNNFAKGYLLSAFAAQHDKFEYGGRLIISHGGGKAESTLIHRGQSYVQQAGDQLANDKSVRALLNNFRERRPLVLLVDDKYAHFPYDLDGRGITYAVLGFYMIINAWAEYQPAANDRGRVVRYKFAFQWCDSQGTPWWIRPDDGKRLLGSHTSKGDWDGRPVKKRKCKLSELRSPDDTDLYGECVCCSRKSPRVYQAWVCLVPDCPLFWKTPSGEDLSEPLQYNPGFLRLDVLPQLPPGYESVVPPPPTAPVNGNESEYVPTSGWHCSKCGRLTCRYKWEHWECKNCHATFVVKDRIRTARDFWTQTISVNFRDHSIARSSGILQQQAKVYRHESGYGQYQTFVLPQGRGFIHHIQPGNAPGKQRADMVFQQYQEQATSGELEFRRWPLRAHKCRGPLLTNYFSHNSGEPYQYVGGTDNTVPFSKAPSAVLNARDLIHDRIKQALGKTVSFNEVLSAAYMEKQKMAFHSDSEAGLGPLVAGLSLGSPALMHFRVREKYDANGESRSIVASFVLRHGDVLVMDGADVQTFYEHTVVPTNFRIAATARCINNAR
ncbi:hypothetical protein BDQ17DRAFT_1354723 [Cyathus striatus]|nr:hypothetical protein BDQ17DRAFT_1354723 [Cyathus striatus]